MNRRSILAAVLLSAVCLSAGVQAQVNIGVINLKSVFDGYYKTKQSDRLVKQRQEEFQGNRQKMMDDYREANQEYKTLNDSANDPAISTEEQARRRKQAEGKLMEIREIEQSVANLDKQFQAEITDQINRMRQNILRDIEDVVAEKANAAGLNLVMDTAAESVNRTPVVLYSSKLTDLTQSVLDKLNETQPAEDAAAGRN